MVNILAAHTLPHQVNGSALNEKVTKTDTTLVGQKTVGILYDGFGDRCRGQRNKANFAIDLG